MKLRIFAVAGLFGLVIAAGLPAADPPSIIGTWVGNMTMADGGDNKLTMVVTSGEEGYAGTIRDEEGLMPEGTGLADIDLTGNKLTFTITTPDLTPINFSFTVGLDSMLGRWEDPTNEANGPVELKRWK